MSLVARPRRRVHLLGLKLFKTPEAIQVAKFSVLCANGPIATYFFDFIATGMALHCLDNCAHGSRSVMIYGYAHVNQANESGA